MEQQLYELPAGWEWITIGERCKKVTDGSHNPPKGKDTGRPMLSSRNVLNGEIVWDKYRLITNTEFEIEHKRSRITDGDILLTIVGTIGRSAVVRDYPELFTLQRSVAVFSSESDVSEFISYQLRSPLFQEYFSGEAKGAAQKGFYLKQLKNTYLALPPINEQKRIVAKLNALFTRIDTAISHLQETLELSKALFASALDTEFSSLSDRVQISEIADVKGGKRFPKGNKLQDKATRHPYIRVADFTDTGSIDIDGLKYISDEIYQQIKRYTIHSNDLYISIAGTIGKTGIIPKELDGANLTENAAKLVFMQPNNIDVKYVYYFTLSHDFSEQAGLATRVVAQPKLALTRLSKIQIPVPPVETQQQIVARLDALSERTSTLEVTTQEKLDDLTALKASLLDAAFRGQF